MEKEQFVKCMTYLGIAYNKEYSKFEVEQHYEFLKEYSYEELKKAIKGIIKKSKFLPKINELIEECEVVKEEVKFNILEIMKNDGYFKDIKEYEKATNFLKSGIIPKWFVNDMNNYRNSQLANNERLYLK